MTSEGLSCMAKLATVGARSTHPTSLVRAPLQSSRSWRCQSAGADKTAVRADLASAAASVAEGLQCAAGAACDVCGGPQRARSRRLG